MAWEEKYIGLEYSDGHKDSDILLYFVEVDIDKGKIGKTYRYQIAADAKTEFELFVGKFGKDACTTFDIDVNDKEKVRKIMKAFCNKHKVNATKTEGTFIDKSERPTASGKSSYVKKYPKLRKE